MRRSILEEGVQHLTNRHDLTRAERAVLEALQRRARLGSTSTKGRRRAFEDWGTLLQQDWVVYRCPRNVTVKRAAESAWAWASRRGVKIATRKADNRTLHLYVLERAAHGE